MTTTDTFSAKITSKHHLVLSRRGNPVQVQRMDKVLLMGLIPAVVGGPGDPRPRRTTGRRTHKEDKSMVSPSFLEVHLFSRP